MIYNRDESEVTTLGNIEKHSVSIDAKNINHISVQKRVVSLDPLLFL